MARYKFYIILYCIV